MKEETKPGPREDQKEELKTTLNYTVDSFSNGIAFGQHKMPADALDPRDYYALRLDDGSELVRLRSRYTLETNNPMHELEKSLMRLSSQGVLRSARVYFGVTTDPFMPFESKFDASMKFLDLFQKYTPGMLTIQTRSPLIVLALPVFRRLGKHVAVTIGVETPCEDVVRAYTPGLPRVSERLKAAEALRKFGVEVTLQVCPVLPYGDWRGDAESFARTLLECADFVHVKPFNSGSDLDRQLKTSEVAKKLARDRKFHYLRKDAATPLITAIERIDSKKLLMPERPHLESRQIEFFAA